MARRNITKLNSALIAIAAMLLGLIVGISAVPQPHVQQQLVLPEGAISYVSISIPAVDQNGIGIATLLTVETRPGEGRILSNIDKLLFWVDTQQSIQIAKAVAENYTGISSSAVDLVYTVKADNASVVGGPSAGAAITVATIAALENRQLKPGVMITGSINEDGSIGEVGSVIEKAVAAKQGGASLFLVPAGQSTETSVKPVRSCEKRDGFQFCETVYKQVTTDVGSVVGVAVKEVSNVSQAMRYFLE